MATRASLSTCEEVALFTPSQTWKRPEPGAPFVGSAVQGIATRSADLWPAPTPDDERHFASLRERGDLDEERMRDPTYRMKLIAWWLNNEVEENVSDFESSECAWFEKRIEIRKSGIAGAGLGVFATQDISLERTDSGTRPRARCVAVTPEGRRCTQPCTVGTTRCSLEGHREREDDAQPFQNYVLGTVRGKKLVASVYGWKRFVGVYRGDVYNWRDDRDVDEMRRRVREGTFGTHHTLRIKERKTEAARRDKRNKTKWGPIEVDGASRGNWLSFLNDNDGPSALEARGVRDFVGLDARKKRKREEAFPSSAHIMLTGASPFHLGAYQIRDIKEGEEIFTSYGPAWWGAHKRVDLPRIGHVPQCPSSSDEGVQMYDTQSRGVGLKAARPFATGETVACMSSETFMVTGADDLYEMLLHIPFLDAKVDVHHRGRTYFLGDPRASRTRANWYNMNNPSAGRGPSVRIVKATDGDGRLLGIRFVATRDLLPGERLEYDYGQVDPEWAAGSDSD